MVFFTPVLRKK